MVDFGGAAEHDKKEHNLSSTTKLEKNLEPHQINFVQITKLVSSIQTLVILFYFFLTFSEWSIEITSASTYSINITIDKAFN